MRSRAAARRFLPERPRGPRGEIGSQVCNRAIRYPESPEQSGRRAMRKVRHLLDPFSGRNYPFTPLPDAQASRAAGLRAPWRLSRLAP